MDFSGFLQSLQQTQGKDGKDDGSDSSDSWIPTEEAADGSGEAVEISLSGTMTTKDDNNNNETSNNTKKKSTTTKQPGASFHWGSKHNFWSFGGGGGGGGGTEANQSKDISSETAAAATTTNATEKEENKSSSWTSFFSSPADNTKSEDGSAGGDAMVQNVLNSWITRQQDDKNDVSQGKSITDLKVLLDKYSEEMKAVADKYFGDMEFQNLSPISLFYYLEREDETKNPSWKCRKHRFHQNLTVEDVVELNRYFHYADLAYTTDMTEIREVLANPKQKGGGCGGKPYDLVHGRMQSEPHEPAFYVAVKRGSIKKNNTDKSKCCCKLLLAIRGTASIEDVITDVLCDSVDYNGGRAHAGILKSGQFIVQKFLEFLEEFVKEIGVEGTMDVLIVGHSLGGGAACIAGYELENNKPSIGDNKINLRVRVVGFGTPGVLSKELGEQAHYITTVVNDADMIPRTSGETMVNVALNVMEYDWTDKAKLDADLMLKDLQSKNSWIMPESLRTSSFDRIKDYLDTDVKAGFRPKSTKRLEPLLFPPGNCIHLWRNGSGISGSIVPGTFFDEVDISRTMIDDHLCESGYRATFLQLMRQHHNDPHFRFDSMEDLKAQDEEPKKE